MGLGVALAFLIRWLNKKQELKVDCLDVVTEHKQKRPIDYGRIKVTNQSPGMIEGCFVQLESMRGLREGTQSKEANISKFRRSDEEGALSHSEKFNISRHESVLIDICKHDKEDPERIWMCYVDKDGVKKNKKGKLDKLPYIIDIGVYSENSEPVYIRLTYSIRHDNRLSLKKRSHGIKDKKTGEIKWK